jgi:hypothetical protein
MIAWREFETVAKVVVRRGCDEVPDTMYRVVKRLPLRRSDQDYLWSLWSPRKNVMHNGFTIKKGEAEKVLRGVAKFIEDNAPEYR